MPPRLAAAVAGMSLALLGIAIANVAGLMMMRTVSRAPELAIRRALGASEGQIFRQVLYEALILAGVGTILGLVMALVLALVFVGTVPADLAPWQLARPAFEMELMADARVVVFAFALAALAGLAAGMLPAWRSTLLSRAVTLHGGGTMTPQPGRPRLQHLVVLPQVVLAIGLLCVAGALVGQALRSELVESGYDADSLVFADYLVPPPPRCEITKAAVSELMERRRLANRGLLEGAQRLEGVASPALATGLPPALHTSWVVPREAPTHIQVSHTYASLSYFDTLGIRIERGHAFSSVDTAMSQPVAVISMSLARQLWNEDDPLGRDVGLHHLGDPAPPRWLRVIGIAGDIRLPLGDGRPEPMLYTLLDQTPNLLASTLVVKARRDPRSVFGGVRELLEQTDSSLRVYRVQSMSESTRTRSLPAADGGGRARPRRCARPAPGDHRPARHRGLFRRAAAARVWRPHGTRSGKDDYHTTCSRTGSHAAQPRGRPRGASGNRLHTRGVQPSCSASAVDRRNGHHRRNSCLHGRAHRLCATRAARSSYEPVGDPSRLIRRRSRRAGLSY